MSTVVKRLIDLRRGDRYLIGSDSYLRERILGRITAWDFIQAGHKIDPGPACLSAPSLYTLPLSTHLETSTWPCWVGSLGDHQLCCYSPAGGHLVLFLKNPDPQLNGAQLMPTKCWSLSTCSVGKFERPH